MNGFPVLLADIEGLFGVVFFVIAFVGWILNLSKENKQVQQRKDRNQPPQAKAQGMQNEIDQFLKETKRGEKRRPQQPQPTRREEFLSDDEIEIVEEAPQGRAPQQRQRKRVTQSQPTSPVVPKPTPQASVARISQPPKRKKSRIKSLVPNKQNITQAVPNAIHHNVASHMGTFSAEAPTAFGQKGMAVTTRNKRTPATAIIMMMRTKTRVRDAIIVNEVLSRPISLRRPSST